MRSWFSLLSSLPVAIAAAAPGVPRIELHYELMRNGTAMAEVVERLEQGNGAYHLTETWKGQGMYRLLGRATRVSKGELAQLGPRPREFTDERSGRDTQRVTFDWSANTITRRYKGGNGPSRPRNTQDRLFPLRARLPRAKGEPVSFPIGRTRHFAPPTSRTAANGSQPGPAFETKGNPPQGRHGRRLGDLARRRAGHRRSASCSWRTRTRYEHMVTRVSR